MHGRSSPPSPDADAEQGVGPYDPHVALPGVGAWHRGTASASWPDTPAWALLRRGAGTCGILCVLSSLGALVPYALDPPPVSGGEATLRVIADHRASYIAQQLLRLVSSLFGLIVLVGLLVALFPASPGLAVLAFTVGAGSWSALLAVPVTTVGTLSLVYLSDGFTAETDAAARSSLVAAAEAFVAENTTVSLAGALTPLGMLLISRPMTRAGAGKDQAAGLGSRDCRRTPLMRW